MKEKANKKAAIDKGSQIQAKLKLSHICGNSCILNYTPLPQIFRGP